MKAVFYLVGILLLFNAVGVLEADINNIIESFIYGSLGIVFLFTGFNINNLKQL